MTNQTDSTATASHTPGPWTAVGVRVYREYNSADQKMAKYVASCETHGDYSTLSEQYGNARLIAAAPALLDASRAVIAAWESGDLAGAVNRLQAAIQSATL